MADIRTRPVTPEYEAGWEHYEKNRNKNQDMCTHDVKCSFPQCSGFGTDVQKKEDCKFLIKTIK